MKRFFLSLCVMMLLFFCFAEEEAVPELLEPVGVNPDLATVYRGDLVNLKEINGFVAPETMELSFEKDGTVKKTYVFPGDFVKEGDLLAELDFDDNDEYIAELEVQLDRMIENDRFYDEQDELTLGIMLAKNVPSDEYEEAELLIRQQDELREFDIDAMNETILAERKKTEGRYLYAPIAGTITYVNPENNTVQNEAYIVIVNEEKLFVNSEYISTTTAQSAKQLYALIGGDRYELEAIPMDIKEYIHEILSGGTVYTQYEFVSEHDKVQAGDFAAVIYSTSIKQDVLLIPRNAILSGSTGKYVYRMVDGERVRTNIMTGINNGIECIVTEGLSEGDIVYVAN